ncbi:MAG: glutamate-1-semialdehyde 2,1-aminomutase [Candidatus Cloacimonetes bacterium 4572_65]|nr:MAG: glutamate-1-semialdehyde 2,1-aminomutase [Candidatus Cloacimonetes bacterium 4572_65]
MSKKLNLEKSMKLYEEALQLVPGAVAGIRRPYNFVPGEYPIFFDRADGGKVWDVDGNEYLDFLCAYGPIIIGHREESIDDAVIEQIKTKGFCFSLTQEPQNKLIKKLIEHIPSCEMAALLKTGSDSTSAAVRVARAYTEKKIILRCGYHGWHDWCSEVKGGILEKAYEDTIEFHYNNIEQLEALMEEHKGKIAGIIITPVGHPLGHPVEMPKPGYLEAVRELATNNDVVLIFDEIRSGFRFSLGGAQKYFGVTPDLSTFGKAMANGYAIAALVGKEKFMKVLGENVFLSSTYFPNSDSQVAAIATIEFLEKNNVIENIEAKGKRFAKKVEAILEESGLPVTLSGAPFMPFLSFTADAEKKYKKARVQFYTELIRRGVFLQPYHHGYIAFRHTDEQLDHAAEMIKESLEAIKSVY